MADLTAPLADFLAEAGRTPFAWGRRDCLIWLADWVGLVRGVDPASAYRGRYSTALGCARLLKREGGLLALAERQARRVGLERTDTPRAADIGVLRAATARGVELAGAICTGPRWAVLGVGGLACGPAMPVMAWRV